jgi:hypothetical protein
LVGHGSSAQVRYHGGQGGAMMRRVGIVVAAVAVVLPAGLAVGGLAVASASTAGRSGASPAAASRAAQPALKASGPITISGKSHVVIKGYSIRSATGNCITVANSTDITIEDSQIGPCGTAGADVVGNGIEISGSDGVHIYDSYIHPETLSTGCCDHHDGIFGNGEGGGNRNVDIQGNVIAYGESNIEFTQKNSAITVIGNFLLNPRGPSPRGQNFQCWGDSLSTPCAGVTLRDNYTLASTDTRKYLYPDGQQDSINLGFTDPSTTQLVTGNYVTGGQSASGCGIIADDNANSVQFTRNLLLNTGQCGIGIADGTNQLVHGNKVYNTNPVPGGGNTAIYTWQQYSAPCGPTMVSGNIADEIRSGGTHSGFWNGGGCGTTASGNTWGAAADRLLTPVSKIFPAPLIPPQPRNCIATSPYTTNTQAHSGKPPC